MTKKEIVKELEILDERIEKLNRMIADRTVTIRHSPNFAGRRSIYTVMEIIDAILEHLGCRLDRVQPVDDRVILVGKRAGE